MSKSEILKSLPTPADVRQNVQELRQMLAETSERLDATARQVQSLEQLPDLVTEQVTMALMPLLSISKDVGKALLAFDSVTKVQRASLEALAREISDRATTGMEQKAAGLDQTLRDLASQVQGLKSSMASMEASSKAMHALPKKLASAATDAANEMQSSAGELARQAQQVRPSPWLVLTQMLGAAVLGALLVAAGQAALNRLLPPSATQQSADYLESLWAKASENERKLMREIVSRPAR